MVKFEGNINGKVYTDEKEFNEALSKLTEKDYNYISYKYIQIPSALNLDFDKELKDNKNCIDCNKIDLDCAKYVSDNEYIRNITCKKDINPDDELINKLKCASNKSEIKRNVYKKLAYFKNLISGNLLQINELKSDYKKFEEKINLINSQIKTLDNENNNYCLNKEYYTNILKYLENSLTPVSEKQEEKENCDCGDKCCDKCNCNNKDLKSSCDYSFEKTPREVLENLNIYNLSDLVDYFLKKY